MAVAQLTLFGKFELRLENGRLLDLPGQKDRALLAILALSSGAALSREKLTGLLWSDRGDAQARDSLKHALKHIRELFDDVAPQKAGDGATADGRAGDGPIATDRHEVRLAPDWIGVDVIAFEALVRTGTPEALKEADRLSTGEFLEGIVVQDAGFESWLLAERERLRRLQEQALTKLLAPSLDTEIRERAALRLLELDPTREPAARILMQIHVERGESTQAVKIFEALRKRLQSELGVKPEQKTLETYEAIRSGRLGAADTQPAPLPETRPATPAAGGPVLLDKPSIAVLPFINMSADPEQAYFVDGLTEDLITDLSKVPDLFVIARQSSFAYKGKAIDVRQIARELGVHYILEGSARRTADRVRINAQLVDPVAGGHIWADRFDRSLADIFAVQDEVIATIVEALIGKLTASGLRERYRPANLEAYDLCVRGRARVYSTDVVEAIPLFERAIALDPNYAEAHRWLAFSQSVGWLHMNLPMDPFRRRSIESAKKAVALDHDDSGAHWVLAWVLLYERLWEESAREFEIALRLNPNDADAWSKMSDLKVMEGRGAEAVACVEKALRLSPQQPSDYYWDLGQAHYAAGQYEAAVKALHHETTYRTGSRRFLAAALAQLGRLEEAREEARLYLAMNPHFRIGYWVETQPFRDLAMRDRFVEGYRKAGLPE